MGARSGGNYYAGSYGTYHKDVTAAANKVNAARHKFGGFSKEAKAAESAFQKVWNKTYGVPKTSTGKVDYNHYGSVINDALGIGNGY